MELASWSRPLADPPTTVSSHQKQHAAALDTSNKLAAHLEINDTSLSCVSALMDTCRICWFMPCLFQWKSSKVEGEKMKAVGDESERRPAAGDEKLPWGL
jgi:hypothetical protein